MQARQGTVVLGFLTALAPKEVQRHAAGCMRTYLILTDDNEEYGGTYGTWQ